MLAIFHLLKRCNRVFRAESSMGNKAVNWRGSIFGNIHKDCFLKTADYFGIGHVIGHGKMISLK